MASRTSKAAIGAARLLRYKTRSNRLLEGMMDIYQQNPLSRKFCKYERKLRKFPKKLSGTRVIYSNIAGRSCGLLEGSNKDKVILFLHGGAYIMGPTQYTWVFMQKLCQLTGWNGIIPDYPKAPEWNSQRTLDYMDRLLRELYRQYAPENIVLAGSSAGGGLALASMLRLRDQGLPLPGKLILISPWLDLSMSYHDVKHLEELDISLSRPTLLRAANLYCKGESILDPHHSPLKSDFKGFPPTMLLTGSEELFVEDCRHLKKNMTDQAISLLYIEEEGLFHSWPVVHMLPESGDIRPKMARFIQGNLPWENQ